MRWVLDSNVWIEAAAGVPHAARVLAKAATIVSSDFIDRAIQLRKQIRIKAPDAIVAATALLQRAELVTRNTSDFQRLTGLSVLDAQSF